MFPRPRKITRFLVFIFAVVFIFSSYVYIFSSTVERAASAYDVTNLDQHGKVMSSKVRSIFFPERTSESSDDDQKESSQWDYEDEESAEMAEEFKNSVHSIFQKSAYFRDKKQQQQCLDEKVLLAQTVKAHNKSFSDLAFTTSDAAAKYVNPHNFTYIHNPSDMCTKRSVSFLVYIHSSPGNLKKRQTIRQSWGSLKVFSLVNASLVFILGATHEDPVQNLVNMEANKYGDIVQENFIDSYRNLTYKGMTALKWAANYCKCAAFVFKADDDILLDIVSVVHDLVTHIIPSHGANRLVLCNLWTRMRTMRNKKSKWYLSKEEFPPDTFPPYCSGSFFILSSDIIPEMYNMALNSKFFWVDDYFITGALVNSLKIKHVPFNQVYLLNYNVVEEKLKHDRKEYLVFHIRQLSLFQRMWPLMAKRHKGMRRFLQNTFKPFSKNIFVSSNPSNDTKIISNMTSSDWITRRDENINMTSSKYVLTRAFTTQNVLSGRSTNRSRA